MSGIAFAKLQGMQSRPVAAPKSVSLVEDPNIEMQVTQVLGEVKLAIGKAVGGGWQREKILTNMVESLARERAKLRQVVSLFRSGSSRLNLGNLAVVGPGPSPTSRTARTRSSLSRSVGEDSSTSELESSPVGSVEHSPQTAVWSSTLPPVGEADDEDISEASEMRSPNHMQHSDMDDLFTSA
eukprot:CAMPEP_0175986500 /NCGR_PEP_ID=MMETSP0108-20121206/50182_1 /TAXON_ID=195067 ORGANISM="Goniomonas pacifica, Strain CCMP1869" /NCGR_SAMPLE_ID=MMETSP0108 /ASSEMBLY_ACC=CAM_ASM_000204 /LENGTH=182 /DNA_ID=CAMNT_0017317661 /DNA_START=54 /DNA_END=599 /DNA_ORIENTATION=-